MDRAEYKSAQLSYSKRISIPNGWSRKRGGFSFQVIPWGPLSVNLHTAVPDVGLGHLTPKMGLLTLKYNKSVIYFQNKIEFFSSL